MKLVDPSKTWFVCRSNIRQEEKAALSIHQAGFDVYLPRMRAETKDRKTKVISETVKPLLTGYLFVGFTSWAKHFEMVRDCDGVYDFIKVAGEPIPLPSDSIVDIQVAEQNMVFDDTRKARIHRGEEERTRKATVRKRFPSGATVLVADEGSLWANWSGIVENVTKTGNVTALMEIFGRLTRVEFDPGQLKPAA